MKRLFSALLIAATVMMLAGCRTPLVSAILSDQTETVKALIDKGADVNEKGQDNFTPLHWAAYYGKTEMVKILLSKGAQANAGSTSYGTPLIIAAQYGFTDTVKVLVEKGADVNMTDGAGRTALSYAEIGKYEAIVQLLKASETMSRTTAPPAATASGKASAGESSPTTAGSLKTAEEPSPGSGRQEKHEKPAVPRGASQVKVAVFHFTPLNMEASHHGITATNSLITTLKLEPSFVVLDRKDLEIFLAINDLQQDDRTENVLNIGTRLGLNVVVAGSIEKRGSQIITNCKVVSIDQQKALFTKQSRSQGEANLISDMKKLSDAITDALLHGPS
ncbi:MAG: ankyrin repeat domain-containing protein [Deltaproteobacteria bacterium]|nr:ankyrin repeat domain-containing protein [Deltaproteobacteria bacterium]